jgi:peptidoglycan DL-endopeptidase CwlO
VSRRNSTHRSAAPTVTPFGRIPSGRTFAAGCLAAGSLLVGLPSAAADGTLAEAGAIEAAPAAPAAGPVGPVATQALPTVALPASAESAVEATSLTSSSFSTISVTSAAEIAAAEKAAADKAAAEKAAAEKAAAEKAAADRAAAEKALAQAAEKKAAQQAAEETSSERSSDRGEQAPAPKAEKASSSPAAGGAIIDFARQAIGTPYVHGAESLSGMDCSGLVIWAYNQAGLDVSGRTADQIMRGGQSISMSEAQPGDLVGYKTGGDRYTHMGIYVGGGKVIDASNNNDVVVERDMWSKPEWHAVTYR